MFYKLYIDNNVCNETDWSETFSSDIIQTKNYNLKMYN